MPTQQQVQNKILAASLKAADMTATVLQAEENGLPNTGWSFIKQITRFITAVTRQYTLGDYDSPSFLQAYDCLCKFTGEYGGGNIDPNFSFPGIIIDVTETFTPTPPYTKTQANLVYDSVAGQWYLPFLDNNGNVPPRNTVPVLVTTTASEGSFSFQVIDDVTPWRIYTFPDNSTQTIVVYVTP